jgi:hypothetical protein
MGPDKLREGFHPAGITKREERFRLSSKSVPPYNLSVKP